MSAENKTKEPLLPDGGIQEFTFSTHELTYYNYLWMRMTIVRCSIQIILATWERTVWVSVFINCGF